MLRLDISSRNIDLPDTEKEYVRKKLGKMEKYLDLLDRIEIVFYKEGEQYITEAVCHIRRHDPIVVKKSDSSIHAGIDHLHDILESKLSRLKGKIKHRKSSESTRVPSF